MAQDFCPKCRMLKNMTDSESVSTEKDDEGNKCTVITTSYYCDTCHTFIKSEDKKIPDKIQ